MSILIPGMMPKDGECVVVFPGGVVQKYKAGGIAFFEYQDRTEEAVAVQLPPHGRLGDLDAMAAKDNADYEDAMASIADVSLRSIVCKIHDGAQKMIAEAETILQADPEEGGAEG